MSPRGPSAHIGLCAAAFLREEVTVDVRHCVCSRPLASGSRSSHLVWKISDWARAGHLQLQQAFGSQTQKHFSYWKEGGNQQQKCLCWILEGKGLTRRDCRGIIFTEGDEVLVPLLQSLHVGGVSVSAA